MKNVGGAIALKIQRVGINFTFIQNIVNIPKIKRMLAKRRSPKKFNFPKLTLFAIIFFKNNNNARVIPEIPISGMRIFLSYVSGGKM